MLLTILAEFSVTYQLGLLFTLLIPAVILAVTFVVSRDWRKATARVVAPLAALGAVAAFQEDAFLAIALIGLAVGLGVVGLAASRGAMAPALLAIAAVVSFVMLSLGLASLLSLKIKFLPGSDVWLTIGGTFGLIASGVCWSVVSRCQPPSDKPKATAPERPRPEASPKPSGPDEPAQQPQSKQP
jgi:hypothetical protein